MSDIMIESGLKLYDDEYVKMKYSQYCKLIEDKLRTHQKPHDRRFKQGFFVPKKPQKCLNIMETSEPSPIVYRSSWEKVFAEKLDETDSVIRWGSEIVKILYKNPIKNKMSYYVPDIYMEYIDKSKKLKKLLVEIKPMNQSRLSECSNGYDKLQFVVNQFKWAAAIDYCKKRDIDFRVMTAHELGLG